MLSEEIRTPSEYLPSIQRHSIVCTCSSLCTVCLHSGGRNKDSKMYRVPASHHFKGSLLILTILSLLTACVHGDSNIVALNVGSNIVREETPAIVNSRQLSVLRGVPDTIATVGKVFKYSIPSDAFAGDISHLEINEAGGAGLPSWLSFDKTTQTLEGIPIHEDLNQYYLALTAHGNVQNGSVKATDVFSISIVSGTPMESVAAMPLKDYNKPAAQRKCTGGELESIATIILDADWSKMSPKERVSSVMRMAEYSGFDRNLFQLLPAGKGELFDPAALVAGPGNIKKQNYPGILLSWPIGCGYDVNKLPVVIVIETTSKDGALAENIGHNVIGWHVTNPQSASIKRMKRQVAAVATVVPTVTPTKPTPTKTSMVEMPTEVETTAVPSGIVVPTEPTPVMSKPVRTVTKVAPTKSMPPTVKPTDTRVRTPSASPTRKVPPKSKTASMMTHMPMPTPTPVPTRPTDTVTEGPHRTFSPPMPTVTETEGLTTMPEMTTTPSKTDAMPFPSATYIEPTPSATVPEESAKPLPTKNTSPKYSKQLDRLEAQVSRKFEYVIPPKTFRDREDGHTRNLALSVQTYDGKDLDPNSWLQFDSEEQILSGVPTKLDIGTRRYWLTATDSGGKNVKAEFEITVVEDDNNTPEQVNEIGELTATEGVQFDYLVPENIFKDPEDGMTRNLKLMVVDSDGMALDKNSWLQFDSQSQRLTGTPTKSDIGSHQYFLVAMDSGGKELRVPFEIEVEAGTATSPPVVSNQPPVLLNPIDKIYAYQGSLLNYRIREDEFYDPEDGNTRNLKLMFLTIDGVVMRPESWIQFDSENQTLYGLPMEDQLGIHEFLMSAVDQGGKIARDAFEIEVLPSAHKPNHEFRLNLKNDFKEFEENINKKTDLVNRIAGLYGDPDASAISVLYFKKGSTIFGWTNNSIPYTPCPNTLIGAITWQVLNNTDSDKGNPSQALVDALAPDYQVNNVSVTAVGPCGRQIVTDEPAGPGIGGSASAMSEEVLWIKIMIPFIVVAVALLLGGLIFFILYRASRKGKLSDEDQNTFIKKGIPIIFAGELEDSERPPSSKTPLIMKEEKPPLPPEYQRQDSPNSSQPLLARSPEPDREEDDDGSGSPPYQRPPPFSSSPPESRSSRQRFTPAYRSPPPYVPP